MPQKPQLFFELIPGADTSALSARGYDLARKLACLPPDASITRDEHGKPYFDHFPDVHFNISHSGSALALAVHKAPVGVDTERIGTPDFLIARRFFLADEQKYVEKNAIKFYEIWTKKEAYIKYTGEGLSRPLRSFSVFLLKDIDFMVQLRGEYIVSLCCRSLQ
jgi:4'-phosphopantetheinyl transferase